MSIRQSRLHRTIFAALMVLTSPPIAAAQNKDAAQDKTASIRQRVVGHVLDDFRKTAQAHLLVRVAEIRKICNLSDSVSKKLRVAAKGGAGQFVKRFERNVKSGLSRRTFPKGFEVRVRGKVINLTDMGKKKPAAVLGQRNYLDIRVEIRSFGIQLWIRRSNGASSRHFRDGSLSTLRQQPIWKKTLQRLLTVEQRELLQKSIKQRLQRLTRAAIAFRMSQLDSELRLTDKQQQHLTALISNGFAISESTRDSVQRMLQERIKKLDVKKLAKVLSKPQMKIWDSLVAR